ncbi:MAG: hypothetical protein JNK78_13900 [Planctomycetes bacterium]|nr:hypothetical protein [Planctomycetota bacterium]
MKGAAHARLGVAALAASLIAASVGLQRWLVLAPDVVDRLRDDAFYEFAWAANVARGLGPVVSDGVSTSGVQILWSALLVPIAWFGGAAALPAIAPWLGFSFHLAAAAGWYFSMRDRLAGLCIAMCWLGNPLLLREAQNGQETALACLLAQTLWLSRRASQGRFVGVSVLAVLARSDLFGLVLALSAWRGGCRAFVAPTAAFAVFAGANVWLGGGIWPDSALPMAWLWHANFAATSPDLGSWFAQVWWFARPVLLGGPWATASAMGLGFAVFAVVRSVWPASLRALPSLVVGAACALGARDLATAGWIALFLALVPRARPRPVPRDLAALVLGLAAIVALHWAIRWYPRDYYVAPLVVGAAAAIARFRRWRTLLLVAAVAQIVDGRRIGPEPLAGQRQMEIAGRCLDDLVPAGERVGSFNSGIVTFHADVLRTPAERRGVVNLDGVVDSRSFRALRDRRLGAWLDEQGIRFVLDDARQFSLDVRRAHACGRWFGDGFAPDRDLVEIARFTADDTGGPRLYWRKGRGVRPQSLGVTVDLGPGPTGSRYVLWPARAGAALEGVGHDGAKVLVARSDADSAMVVFVPASALFGGALFERGVAKPVLTLPKL